MIEEKKTKYKITDGVTEVEGERPAFKVLHGASLALAYLCERGYETGEIRSIANILGDMAAEDIKYFV